DREETRAFFKSDLYKYGVQPVWLEITNSSQGNVSVLPAGLDPGYFSPIEVANLDLKLLPGGNSSPSIDALFFNQSLETRVQPGETRRGFIFSALDEGTKAFNVDIVSTGLLTTFTFFIQVPGLHIDHYNVDWNNLYAADEIRDLDDTAVRTYLAAQTCCTTNKTAKGDGDPVNLVVIGTPDDVYTAFIRAGWDETETITGSTSWKTMQSFISGGEYRYSPVSGLYVFGRPQDVAFQKARDNIHERNHLRLWMSPVTFKGVPVWMGQISRDIGVRFTKKTITTHKIDPDTDETREFLLEDMAYSQALAKFAYVEGAIPAPIDEPRGNFTGDPYFTDGYRLVMWVTSTPVDTNDIEFVPWSVPPGL
ncbi:MAG: LssY C-terminal domain-containing protein, partial [Xanthomonadales bacterium]|nr:LssY C-terminal domain-containing protein [Xanthomonadales bacterium]